LKLFADTEYRCFRPLFSRLFNVHATSAFAEWVSHRAAL